MDKTELITPRPAPISCPFESALEGTAKKCRNNSYVPSIKCTSISSPVSSRKAMLQDRANDLGDQCHVMAHSKSTLQLRASCVVELIHSVLRVCHPGKESLRRTMLSRVGRTYRDN